MGGIWGWVACACGCWAGDWGRVGGGVGMEVGVLVLDDLCWGVFAVLGPVASRDAKGHRGEWESFNDWRTGTISSGLLPKDDKSASARRRLSSFVRAQEC